jgi:hypothetical protein
MMISYRLFIAYSELVPQQNTPNLPHLVRLCLRTSGLQVDYLYDPFFPENVVIASDPLRELQVMQEASQVGESNIRIRAPAQDSLQDLPMLTAYHSVRYSVTDYAERWGSGAASRRRGVAWSRWLGCRTLLRNVITKGSIDGFRIGENLVKVRIDQDDVCTLPVPLGILATDA